MKNVISLLVAALLASVLASGCGKKEKCSDVTTQKECVDASFVETLKGKCEYKDGKCKDKVTDPHDGDKKKCEAAKKDQNTCDAASATLAATATHKCKFKPESAAGAGDQTCEFETR